MWVCPKCGREFKRTNQGHYCGDAPKTVAEYIGSQEVKSHPHLIEIADIIKESIPCVKERVAWSMPTYENAGKSVSFSACKNHVSFYIGDETIEKFASELHGFVTRKNAVYFPYQESLPSELIENMVKWRLM